MSPVAGVGTRCRHRILSSFSKLLAYLQRCALPRHVRITWSAVCLFVCLLHNYTVSCFHSSLLLFLRYFSFLIIRFSFLSRTHASTGPLKRRCWSRYQHITEILGMLKPSGFWALFVYLENDSPIPLASSDLQRISVAKPSSFYTVESVSNSVCRRSQLYRLQLS